MREIAFLIAVTALALPALAGSSGEAVAFNRTWVSGSGSDSNDCTRPTPCATFATALAATNAGGEINCLDGGSFGQVTIDRSVTISCEAGTAGITATSGRGVFVNPGSNGIVTLRGLDINGLGTGARGIEIGDAREVHIEKCAISNFLNVSATGILAQGGTTVFLFVLDTVISDNTFGVSFLNNGGFKIVSIKNTTITGSSSDGVQAVSGNVFFNITESVISGNGGSAVNMAAAFAEANIDRTTMTNNAVALNASASGATIRAVGNNIFNNTTAFGIAAGATIATDGQNRTGGNAGGQNANASITLK